MAAQPSAANGKLATTSRHHAPVSNPKLSRLSPTPPEDGRSPSPGAGSVRSSVSVNSSLSEVAAITASDGPPQLPAVVSVRECILRKRPPDCPGPGWGFVLRGTTREFVEGTKVYTCHIESVHEDGTAKSAGLKEGDQIVCVDAMPVKGLNHGSVVKMFQTRDKVHLVVLPVQYKSYNHARITPFNIASLNFLWAMMTHLHSLEIINVNLDVEGSAEPRKINVGYLLSLRSLSVSHCSLTSLTSLNGLEKLLKLESLSLASNFLTHESIGKDSALAALTQLKSLNLNRNLLNQIPDPVFKMQSLEMLTLVENNISHLPMSLQKLRQLHTLCMDSNLLQEVDKTLSLMPSLQKFTVSGNSLECEPQALKLREFLITSVTDNPYTTPNESGVVSRDEPSLRRTVSVRGQVFAAKRRSLKRYSLDWDAKEFVSSDYVLATQ